MFEVTGDFGTVMVDAATMFMSGDSLMFTDENGNYVAAFSGGNWLSCTRKDSEVCGD